MNSSTVAIIIFFSLLGLILATSLSDHKWHWIRKISKYEDFVDFLFRHWVRNFFILVGIVFVIFLVIMGIVLVTNN